MPTTRRHIKRKPMEVQLMLSKSLRHYLENGGFGFMDDCKDCPHSFNTYLLTGSDEETQEAWEAVRDFILSEWILRYPGTRPWAWWKFSALKSPVKLFGNYKVDAAQRKRLGGIGCPTHEVFGDVPIFSCGIPASWVTKSVEKYYGSEFKGKAIDPEDPPRFESQASFLDRHGLLAAIEKRKLKASDFEPVKIRG